MEKNTLQKWIVFFYCLEAIPAILWGEWRGIIKGKRGNNSRNRQKTALWAISSCSWRQGGDVWGESVRGWEAGGSRRENGELKRSQIIGFEAKTEIWANRQGRGEMSMSIAANDYEVYMTENWTMRVSEMGFLVYSIFLANDWRMWIYSLINQSLQLSYWIIAIWIKEIRKNKKEIEKAIQNFSPPSLVQQSWTQISRKRNKSSMDTSIFSLSPRMRRKSLVLC